MPKLVSKHHVQYIKKVFILTLERDFTLVIPSVKVPLLPADGAEKRMTY